MTTFMEQVADTERWIGTAQHEPNASTHANQSGHSAELVEGLPRSHRKALLASIVEAEILPRLARSRPNAAAAGATVPAATSDDDTVKFVSVLLTEESCHAIAFIETLRLRGVPPASLYLGVMTQAAQRLGELWDQDRCDFAQVTISMGRLQQVARALSPYFQLESLRRPQTENALLVPAPGEQHTFGLVMLAEFFRREGWYVAGGPVTSAKDAAGIVRDTWIDVAGFSIGSAGRVEGLAQCIRAVRRVSQNPDLFVMVGGPLLLTQPDLVTRVGADTTATDAAAAVRQARGLLAMRAAAD